MVDGKLIPQPLGCDLVGLALFTGSSTPTIINNVRSALRPDLVNSSFAAPPCDLQHYGAVDPATEKDTPPPPPPGPATPQQVLGCPAGRLYTQFGAESQRSFGNQLKAALSGAATVEPPEVVNGFDATNIVVRYFFAEMAPEAAKWQALLEAALPGTDVKYAYVPGYEAAIGSNKKATFELWWPATKTPAEKVLTPACSSAPATS